MNSTIPFKATVSQAAFVAGITDRDVNRIVDESILPDGLIETANGRVFGELACVFASFYVREHRLSKPARMSVIQELTRRFQSAKGPTDRNRSDALPGRGDWIVVMDALSVNVGKYVDEAIPRITQIVKARAMVVSDADVFDGEPIFAGTRVPVRTIAAWLDEGVTSTKIRLAYPTISESMLAAAPIWARTHPMRGRPRIFGEINPDWKLKSAVRLKLP